MEQTLGYIIFGTGWPVLIIGSIWMWRKVAHTAWSSENVPECHAGDVLRAGVYMHCVLAGPAVADGRPPGVYRFLCIVYCHHKRRHNLE